MVESSTIVWLVVYIAMTVLIYTTYGIALSIHEYKDKDDERKRLDIGVLAIFSALTFLSSGASVMIGYPLPAAALLFVSLILDYILGIAVGPGALNENGVLEVEPGLVAAIYIPIVTKTLLFGYLTYASGAWMQERGKYKLPGTGQFRRQGESFTDYRSRRGYPSRS